jgi:hypothetical protein
MKKALVAFDGIRFTMLQVALSIETSPLACVGNCRA